jgi:hypothetical protein
VNLCFAHLGTRPWAACFSRLFTIGLTFAGLMVSTAMATESGASVYPAGIETVMPGMTPPPGGTLLLVFSDFYQANALLNSQGHSEIPGFHLRVAAVAVKVMHNWGLRVLGGTLVSYAALPYLYEHLDGPFGAGDKTGFSNPDIQPAAIAYQRGDWHWWYGLDVIGPGFAYNKADLVNIGQHNFALAPSGAFTYLPRCSTEISSKFQLINNGKDGATEYQSGREFVWEYDGTRNITKKLAVGVNGFYYQQTTDDRQFGLPIDNRGRDVAIGPEIRYHLGHLELIAKYQRDMLVENRPLGNSFWVELGLPIGHGRE